MSSIASKTKTVQRNSTEEIQANQETNENQIPNVKQMVNKNQPEDLHIAEKTTNGERSESRQSGAKHPSESAKEESEEQGYCKTAQAERPSKYKYRVFDGYAGERYLQEIVKDILPTALARTWVAAVSYQAPGNNCYVGTGRLAQRERLRERTIQKDLQALRRRGLLKTYGSWTSQKQADGSWSPRAIVIKDFTRLYDLAYEYHLWMNSEGYIPAEREYADLIKGNKELYNKLVRFDNYRRILCCEKPGRKEQLTQLEQHYQEYYQEEYGQQEAKTNNYIPKQRNKRSPYEETENLKDSITYGYTDSSEDSEEGVFADVAHTAIRNDQQSDEARIDTREQIINKDGEEPKRQEKESKQGWKKADQNEVPEKEEIPSGAAKDVTEYTIEDIKNNPVAVLTFLQQLYATDLAKARKQEQARAAKAQRHQQARAAKRKRHKTPEKLAQVITEIMHTLGGNSQYLQSDLTRATKIYWACTQLMPGFSNPWFLDQLTTAFIETANAKNVRKHVPYFFNTLERNLGLRNDELAYIRSKEVLYCNADAFTFIMELEQLHESSGSPLDYQEWVKQTYL